MKNLFEHYAAIKDMYAQIVMPVCKKHSLTYMEFTVLMFLANNPQYKTAAEIVKYRHLAKSHVSVSVQGLKARGLLVTETQEHDRRSTLLFVHESAQEIVSDGTAAQQRFGTLLYTGFTEEERDMMIQFSERVDQNIAVFLQKRTGGSYLAR